MSKSLDNLSGPWRGMSIQDGRRIPEAIRLTISSGRMSGTGTDADGHFNVEGTYDAEGNVRLTRRYTWTTEPSQQGAYLPYRYMGKWDGTLIAGRWYSLVTQGMGGPFEMWPEREEDLKELAIEFETRELVGTS